MGTDDDRHHSDAVKTAKEIRGADRPPVPGNFRGRFQGDQLTIHIQFEGAHPVAVSLVGSLINAGQMVPLVGIERRGKCGAGHLVNPIVTSPIIGDERTAQRIQPQAEIHTDRLGIAQRIAIRQNAGAFDDDLLMSGRRQFGTNPGLHGELPEGFKGIEMPGRRASHSGSVQIERPTFDRIFGGQRISRAGTINGIDQFGPIRQVVVVRVISFPHFQIEHKRGRLKRERK